MGVAERGGMHVGRAVHADAPPGAETAAEGIGTNVGAATTAPRGSATTGEWEM